jgi:hypothetical protein
MQAYQKRFAAPVRRKPNENRHKELCRGFTIFTGGAVLAVKAGNLIVPSCGSGFLTTIPFYPGCKRRRTARQDEPGASYRDRRNAIGPDCWTGYNRFTAKDERERKEIRLKVAP